ncbi:hypothetical protein HF521_021317 [Silurus meridionalis]|uniref:Uncharacterized protein n=2 Tax=Silurus meridionalis TaxID=175797 RepID=A0A8T0BB33_SILME|nr:hypothetical protein HF521_021317 [Silurus meridionalis]
MDSMWAYSERSNMRKRAARRVNKMFESLEKEISCQPEKRPTLDAIDMSFETDAHESEDEVSSQDSSDDDCEEIMYHIVSFVETEEVEVVPAIWVKDEVCLWPPYKGEEVQRATRNLEQPQESWVAYKVRILYTANNYSEARRKLPLAEQQTDLQSEAETDPLRAPKRKVKRNRRLLDDYDTDEEAIAPKKNLPQAPYIQPLSKRACSALDEVQPSPLQHRPQRSPSVTQVPGTSRQALMERSSTSQWQNFESALGKSLRQAIDLPAQSPAQTLFQTAHQMGPEAENYSELSWQRGSTLQSPEEPTQPLWHRETPRRSYSMDDPFKKSLLHAVLTKLEVVMEQQRHIVRMIQDLKSNNVREITEENEISPTLFPVEDLRSLTSLESNLRSSPETRRKVRL